MAAYQEEWPALVVVPASCRLQWVEELERWLPGLLPPCAIHVIQGSADRVRWVPDTQHPDGGAQAPGQVRPERSTTQPIRSLLPAC